MNKIRLLITANDRILRNCLVEILKTQANISILATSGNDNNILQKIKQFNPNIILLEKRLENENSLSALITFKNDFPLAKIIVMDTIVKQSEVLLYLKAGASGFIFKDSSLNNFLINIRTTNDNSNVMPPLLTDSLFSQIVKQTVSDNNLKTRKSVLMTSEEKYVNELFNSGQNIKKIAKTIGISSIEVKDLINRSMDILTKNLSDKLLTVIKLMNLLEQFPTVNRWSIINLSAKYDLTKRKGIHSPERANSFMILLPNNVTLFFYVSESNKKLVSMQEFLSKRKIAIKEEAHKKLLRKESVKIAKENNLQIKKRKKDKKSMTIQSTKKLI